MTGPKRRPSGNLEAQKAKIAINTTNEETIPMVRELRQRIANARDRVRGSSSSPPGGHRDPRRDPEDFEGPPSPPREEVIISTIEVKR